MISDTTKENSNKVQIGRKSKYVDDMTLFMAWQNYQLINYSWSSYCYASFLNFSANVSSTLPRVPPTNTNQTFFQEHEQQHHYQQVQNPVRQVEYRVVKLASTQKRLMAELIDFLILAVVKAITILTIYGNSYIEHFDFLVLSDDLKVDNFEWMLFQALIYRLFVVAYEGYLVSGTLPLSEGQTIGKRLLGIKVIRSTNVEVVDYNENTIRVEYNTVGMFRSCFRSLFKNVAISLLFPLILPVLIFNHNRFLHDLLVDTLVIEKDLPPNQ